MQLNTANQLLFGYYAATILFVILDFGFGLNFRLSFLDNQASWRVAYYGFCFACAGVMHWRPNLSVFVGALEGLVTMCGLIFSMFLGITFGNADTLVEMREAVVNYAVSGTFAYISWWKGMQALRGWGKTTL